METIHSYEASSYLFSLELPRILFNPKVHYRVHINPPLIPILRKMDPVHTILFHLIKINFIIVSSSIPRSSQWYFPSGFL
jgi:hypothetical protein